MHIDLYVMHIDDSAKRESIKTPSLSLRQQRQVIKRERSVDQTGRHADF
jgi:hypothetical protein